jgi:hypothetical protein
MRKLLIMDLVMLDDSITASEKRVDAMLREEEEKNFLYYSQEEKAEWLSMNQQGIQEELIRQNKMVATFNETVKRYNDKNKQP